VLSVGAGMDIADRLEETNRKNLEMRKVMVKSLEENVATEYKKWRMVFVQKWNQLSQLAEEESRENAERLFRKMDVDGDENVDEKEFTALAVDLGVAMKGNNSASVYFKQIDTDNSKTISRQEFIEWFMNYLKSVAELIASSKEAFERYDSDGSGTLEKKEFKQLVAEIFDADDIEKISNDLFHEMDEDGGGIIEQAEFEAFFVVNALSMGLQHESREKRHSAAGAAPESLVAL
jgi:Ca2+-binding EF-hand superfamily protein